MIRARQQAAKLTTLAAALALSVAHPTSIQAGELFAVESGSTRVHVIDLATGAATLVNPISGPEMAGIAFDSSGLSTG